MPMLPPPLPFGRRRRTPGVYNKPVEPHWLPPYLFRFRLDNLFGAKVLQVFAVFGRGRQPVAATGGWSGGSSQHPKRRGCIRSGFERQIIADDWDEWTKWISSRGGIGVPANKAWESWWTGEQEQLHSADLLGCFWEIILSQILHIPIWYHVSPEYLCWQQKHLSYVLAS
ncbi:hypothetical protein SETIT_9G518900v2 [Setaria italica]|uniref:Uncharacterized protein n=1 Tax=Setaria italica TaxID=4555 RepID=A0A368SX21_SETIT|nr:uncharacterized protein LOC101772039 [Setaria italica]RCV46280.1 hypothetical protein SETIT_9G518900v2 [Setaria italica]